MADTRKGKIARCPVAIREEVNRRLLDGQPASKIIPWLHSLPEVLAVLDEHFGEEPISPQNLSEWRLGGYKDWLRRREQIDETRDLATFAAKLGAAAGGNLTEGAAAILGGKILEALESATPLDPAVQAEGEKVGLDLEAMTNCVVALRRTDLEARKGHQRQQLLDQRERQVALSEKQFQVRTCELFLEWFTDQRAVEIAKSDAKKEVRMEQLRLAMFPKPAAEGDD
jgi:hypothetical protein